MSSSRLLQQQGEEIALRQSVRSSRPETVSEFSLEEQGSLDTIDEESLESFLADIGAQDFSPELSGAVVDRVESLVKEALGAELPLNQEHLADVARRKELYTRLYENQADIRSAVHENGFRFSRVT